MAESGRSLLSILIPVRNGDHYLAETIESVLRQDWQPIEIVVVDDGSEDRSAEVAEGFGPPVRCVRRPPQGLAAARNAALAEARGEFVAHLDADDLLPPGSIALRMASLAADSALEMVVGRLEAFFSPDLDEAARSRLCLPEESRRGHLSGASIVRARVFRRVGAFDESCRLLPDIDWFMRATESGVRTQFLPDIVVRRRIHGGNMSLTMKDESGELLRILKVSLDRRRATAKRSPE